MPFGAFSCHLHYNTALSGCLAPLYDFDNLADGLRRLIQAVFLFRCQLKLNDSFYTASAKHDGHAHEQADRSRTRLPAYAMAGNIRFLSFRIASAICDERSCRGVIGAAVAEQAHDLSAAGTRALDDRFDPFLRKSASRSECRRRSYNAPSGTISSP